MQHTPPLAPPAFVTLRAHRPAPARVELAYRPTRGRLLRAIFCLAICWGAIPFIIWIPPHYPWTISAFLGGVFLAHRCWTGRYRIRSFAGICPRCGSTLSLGIERTVDLPHTLTCYNCHFEPRLEVELGDDGHGVPREPKLVHRTPHCVGKWRVGWLADEPFLLCDICHGGALATEAIRERARAENESGDLLRELSDEGRLLL